ncbi:MAG: hypothetical protein WC162_02870 [Sphaerochaetaceae bacterium]
MRNIIKTFFLFIFVFIIFSCSQKAIIIDSVSAYPYIEGSSYYGLAIYFTTTNQDSSYFQCHLVSPEGDYEWDFQAQKVSFESNYYYGNSNIAMPNFIPLETGDYQLTVYKNNNSEITKTIPVYYKTTEEIKVKDFPFFDSTKNLTFLESSNAAN